LIQTGKTSMIPVLLLDIPGGGYWKAWDAHVREEMVGRDFVSPEDVHLYRLTETVEDAGREILEFYRVFHSHRFVGEHLVLRIRRLLTPEVLEALAREFQDILKGPVLSLPGPLPAEDSEWPELPRLILPFNRTGYGRLRQLIDFINRS
jgi:hypothetical protein